MWVPTTFFRARWCRSEEKTEMKKTNEKNNENKTNLKSKRTNFPLDLKIT